MLSTGFVKVCFVVAVVEVLMGWNSVYSSSIYVGRHEAGTYSEQTPSESVLSEVSCEDANHRLCNKIIKYYGAGVCNTHDESLLNAVQSVCQATCGFCNTQDCEDEFEDLCTEYGGYCEQQGDFGGLIRDICPKTCSTCHLKPKKEQSNLVVING
ncbi:uncharacterized protein LOC144646243 [Oculina patagonica]